MSSAASLDSFSGRLAALDTTLKAEQEKLRALVGAQLEAMRAGNEAKLEEMRKAVDEKLQSALEKQLKDSFTNLQEQMAAVQQAIGQVQSVAGEVGDLKRLFSNVKSRGGWGEAQLEAMLTDILPAGAPRAWDQQLHRRQGHRRNAPPAPCRSEDRHVQGPSDPDPQGRLTRARGRRRPCTLLNRQPLSHEGPALPRRIVVQHAEHLIA